MPRQFYELPQAVPQARPLFMVTRDVTVPDAATSTIVADQILGGQSTALLTPLNAAAAAIFASLYVSARAKGSLTLTHDAPSGDALFAATLIG